MALSRKQLSVSLLFLVTAYFFTRPCSAVELNAEATGSLLGGTVWSSKVLGAQPATWEWKKDGSVCLRIGTSSSGRCDDRGTWKLEGRLVCYELTWWLKSEGLMSACLGVADFGGGRYEAKLASGSPVMQFTVAR